LVVRKRRLKSAAIVGAVLLHVLVLGIMGWVRPVVDEPAYRATPPVELSLLPPLFAPRPDTPLKPRLALPPERRAAALSPLQGLAVPPPSQTAPQQTAQAEPSKDYSGFYAGALPGCGREDMMLLTGPERVRCREQIEAEILRRTNRNADAEARRRVEAARAQPHVDAMAPAKRGYYDALQAAKAAVRGDFRVLDLQKAQEGRGLSGKNTNIDMSVGVHCSMTFGATLGRLHCPLAPPAGFLTEEARIKPP
jgi:hypothetical protein